MKIFKFLFLFIFITLFGLNNVMASETFEDLGNLNDKTNFYLVYDGSTSPVQIPINQEWNFEDYDINSFIINIDNTVFKKSYTYQLTLTLPKSIITGANAYIVTDSNGDSCATGLIKDMNTNYPKFTFSCGIDTNSIGLKIYNNNGNDIITNRWWFSWTNIQLQRMISSDEELNNTIKNQFSSCRDSYNLLKLIPITQGIATVTDTNVILNGTTNDTYGLKVGEVTLKAHTTYTFESFQEGNKLNSYFLLDQYGNTVYLTENNLQFIVTNANTYNVYLIVTSGTYSSVNFKPMISLGDSPKNRYEKFGEEICINKIDETNDKLDETNDKLNDIEGALTDSSPSDMSGLSDSAGWLPAGPVDSILTLPLTMLNSLVTNLSNNSCQNLILELPFVKENITLPCVKSLYDKMGVTGTLFTTAGLIASAFILFNYLLNLYQWVDSTLTMRENTMPGYFDDNWGGGA